MSAWYNKPYEKSNEGKSTVPGATQREPQRWKRLWRRYRKTIPKLYARAAYREQCASGEQS